MPRTSSGGISNSAAKQFSNCMGRISNDNYNRIVAQRSSYEILTEINGQKPLPQNNYPTLKPLSANQVLLSTGLVKNKPNKK